MRSNKSLSFRYGLNDLIKNKSVNIALFVVLVLSAFMMATGSMVMERLVGSVNQLFDEAKPPHFLQMHQGDYDRDELERFASERPEIDEWLIEEMLAFDGATITWERPSESESGDFSGSLIDNYFVTQNEEFDFLLDQEGEIPTPSLGEIYVPVEYMQSDGLEVGDEFRVETDSGTHEFQVEGFVRDAQMASSLSSATRILVSEEDFAALDAAGGGAPEIIVEYRLDDTSMISDFQQAYESDEALPKDGQAVTYDIIRIINALSDGLVAIALVFLSFLLMSIALLNARFVIRGKLEDEVREIGAMKAIGLPHKSIAGLYLTKYSVMALAACVLGGVLAIFATNRLTENIQVNYAEASLGLASIIVPVVALLLVYLFVIVICRRVLKAVKRIEVVNALVHGSVLNEKQTARRAKRQARRVRKTSLASGRGTNINRRLALLDLRADLRQWILIPTVFFLTALLIILPTNMLSTFESPRFITYMGAPDSDLRVDMQFTDDVDEVRDEVQSAMDADDQIADARVYANELFEVEGEDDWEIFRVEVGDYSTNTIDFLEGEAPESGQIALSVLNAEKFELVPGDELTIRNGEELMSLEVSGTYQDITAGGFTAKMHGSVNSGAAGYVIFADTVDGVDPAGVAEDYSERFASASVIPMHEFVQQTMSYVTGAFKNAAVLSFIFGIAVAVLIISLFLQLRLTSERTTMGVLSAMGFSTNEIIAQIRLKTLIAITAGTVLGVGFTATVGEAMIGNMISLAGLGIADFTFIVNPFLVYVAFPLILIAAGYLGSVLLTARLRGVDKSMWLRGL